MRVKENFKIKRSFCRLPVRISPAAIVFGYLLIVSGQNPAAAELVGRTVITQKCSNNDPRTMVRIVIEAGEIALRTQITNQCSQKVAFTLNAYYRWCPDGQCKPWKKCGLEWNNPFRVDAGASETRQQCSSVGNNEWKIDSTKVEFVGRTSLHLPPDRHLRISV